MALIKAIAVCFAALLAYCLLFPEGTIDTLSACAAASLVVFWIVVLHFGFAFTFHPNRIEMTKSGRPPRTYPGNGDEELTFWGKSSDARSGHESQAEEGRDGGGGLR